MDTTGTGAGSGRASLTLVRSSAVTSTDGESTYTFSFKDISVTRRNAPWRFAPIEQVSVPDSASAGIIFNMP